MSQKASRLPTKTDRLLQNQKKVKDLYALNRLRITPRTIQNPSGGSVGAGGDVSSAAESNSLKTQGDTMIGPIAFFPVDVFIDSTTDPANPSINIGEGAANPPDFSTYVLVTGGTPPTDLSTIFGAAYAGQMLKLQAIVEIVLKDAVANGSGNILTTTNQDETLASGTITEFLFDITASPGGVNGAWRRATTGDGGGGGTGTLAGLADVDFPTSLINGDVLTYNSTSGFWENIPPTGGGMNTDLSNMFSPTAPIVDLVMNNQSITGIKNLDFDDVSSNIQGLKALNFFDSFNTIESSSTGLRYAAVEEHLFQGVNGFIAKFIEVNPTDHRLDMQENKIQNIDKLLFSPVSNIDTTNFSQIYEETAFNNLRYVSKNTHVFLADFTNETLLTIGNIVGGGGNLQDIGFMNFNANEISNISIDGDMQLVFQSGTSGPADFFIRSGGTTRNLSDIGSGGAGNEISQGNTSITIIDAGSGSITDIIDGTTVSTKSVSNFSINQPVSMGTNTLSGLGDATPGANHFFLLGGSTLFWANGYFDRITLQNVGNQIIGSSSGMSHNVGIAGIHEFEIGFTPQLTIRTDEIDVENNNIVAVNDLIFTGSASEIDMNGGDINDWDDMTARGSGSILNMNNGNITTVNFIQSEFVSVLTATTTVDLLITGALDHNGTQLGFFGGGLSSKQTAILADFTTAGNANAINTLIGILQGYGLID